MITVASVKCFCKTLSSLINTYLSDQISHLGSRAVEALAAVRARQGASHSRSSAAVIQPSSSTVHTWASSSSSAERPDDQSISAMPFSATLSPPLSSDRLKKREDYNMGEGFSPLGELLSVEVPRIKVGQKQTIETLINEEILLLAKYLRDENETWIPKMPKNRWSLFD